MSKRIVFSMSRKKIISVIIAVTIMITTLIPAASAANANQLQDVRRGHWFYGAVHYVVSKELMVGTTNTTFSPNDTVTRAMFVQSLYGQDGRPWVMNVRPAFVDVQISDWYSNAVAWASQKKIVTGYADNSFKPNEPITREQMAAIFYRYAVYKKYIQESASFNGNLGRFQDYGSISSWAVPAMNWAVAVGLMAGSDGQLEPWQNTTRAQTAVMLARFNDIYVEQGKVDLYLVKSVAHRGYNVGAPENTLIAYEMAAQQGFDYVETDIQLTKDRVPVVLHDPTINRTARNADGSAISQTLKISDLTLAQARQYDYGSWKGSQFAGTQLPTFEEYVSTCKRLGLNMYIELKGEAGFTIDDVRNLMQIVNNYGMMDKSTWMSFNLDCLRLVNQCKNDCVIAYVTGRVDSSIIRDAQSLMNGTNSVFIDSCQFNDAAVQLCQQAGIPLEAWTLNTPEVMKNASPYISGMTSDGLVAKKILNGWQ